MPSFHHYREQILYCDSIIQQTRPEADGFLFRKHVLELYELYQEWYQEWYQAQSIYSILQHIFVRPELTSVVVRYVHPPHSAQVFACH